MSFLDTLITIFLLASGLSGYRRGVFREVLVTALWLPTLAAIGLVVTHSFADDGTMQTQNLSLLFNLSSLYFLGVVMVWSIDKAFIQPRFSGTLQGGNRVFYKLFGLVVGLGRGWWLLVVGLALYSAYVIRPDDGMARHGLYMPHLTPSAINVQNWLENSGAIQHDVVIYTDEAYSYQSDVDEAKEMLKNSFTQKWMGGQGANDE